MELKREGANSKSVPIAKPPPGALGQAAQHHVAEAEKSVGVSSQKPTLEILAVIVLKTRKQKAATTLLAVSKMLHTHKKRWLEHALPA